MTARASEGTGTSTGTAKGTDTSRGTSDGAGTSDGTATSENAAAARTPAGRGKGETGRGRYHHGDLANALTQAGVGLAREGGPDAVVLREAARRVGVSPAAAYRHFAAHDDLLFAVKLQAQGALAVAMQDAIGGSAPLTDPVTEALRRLTAIGLAYLHFALDQPGLFRTAFCHTEPSTPAPSGPSDELPNSVDHLRRFLPFQILSESLDTLVEVGVLPPERRPHAEIPAWSAVHGLCTLLLDGPLGLESAEDREAVLRQTVNTVINGLVR